MDKQNQTAPRIKKRNAKLTRQYLDAILTLSPAVSAQQMVELRWRFCGFNTTSNSFKLAANDIDERRKWNQNQLEQIRSGFWLMSASEVRQLLDELLVDDLPELKIGVDRLKQLSYCRDDMEVLSQDRKRDINLYNTFRRLVMLSPRKAGSVKEKYLRSLPHAKNIDRAQRMVRMMQKEYPDLYAIESDWFAQILKIKSRRETQKVRAEAGVSFDTGIPSWMYVVTAMLVIRFLFGMMRLMQ